jgi:hypothetical protein
MSESGRSRSAQEKKADDVQAAGSAKAGSGHPAAEEGGHAKGQQHGRGRRKAEEA